MADKLARRRAVNFQLPPHLPSGIILLIKILILARVEGASHSSLVCRCPGRDLYRIYPWVHQYYNNLKSYDQIQMVRFPDVNPCDIPAKLDFSMAAGSYIEIYNNLDVWDCICTCFFLDTAHNVIDYIDTTWNILKPGGYWINLGPLLYHHADLPNENSIEPSYEEIRSIVLKYGFILLKEELNVPTPYAQNPRSMMSYEYKSVFFVCQKPDPVCCIKNEVP
ncbi:UNVERIFIED_CONTAM: Carnmt1 [Trichonephila clavipes]